MSRLVEDIRRAVDRGDLPERFRPDDVRRSCPGWANHTYGVFLPKHRRGNPGGYTEYFLQNPDGTYTSSGKPQRHVLICRVEVRLHRQLAGESRE
jgi:hypothetical protein